MQIPPPDEFQTASDVPSSSEPLRLSALLRKLADRPGQEILLGEISRSLKERGFGAMLILLCAPNLVPMPPGVSTIFGLPMMLIALQLISGYRRPILPRAVRMRSISMETVRRIIGFLEPWLLRFEKIAKPRLWFMPQRQAEILIGALALFMGFILILPIPFGNFPPAVSVILMSFGLGERDGLWAGLGIGTALISTGIVIGVIATAGVAILSFF